MNYIGVWADETTMVVKKITTLMNLRIDNIKLTIYPVWQNSKVIMSDDERIGKNT